MYRDSTLSSREFYVLAPELRPVDPQVNPIRFLAALARALQTKDMLR
jgi:hypothetical protein